MNDSEAACFGAEALEYHCSVYDFARLAVRRYPDKSAKDNSANDTSAKPTVRMPTVRKGQPCECQQCECDSGANVSSANATAVRMRQQCERRISELCKTYQSLSLFFFAKTFATFYLNFWPKNAHNSAVQHLPKDVKVGIHSFLCGETFHTKKTAKNCLIKIVLCKTFCIGEKIQVAKTTTFKRCMHLKPQKTKVHLLKFMVNCFFLNFTRFACQNDFFILGVHVAILLLVVIALYVDRGIPTTARKSGIAETSFLRSSSPTQ